MEKALLKQRFANLAAAQNGYIEKQEWALAERGIRDEKYRIYAWV